MLPFDKRPWAKSLARIVIILSVLAAVVGSYYLESIDQLHVPEITGVLLLLLTIIPPNVAILTRKLPTAPGNVNAGPAVSATLHTR